MNIVIYFLASLVIGIAIMIWLVKYKFNEIARLAPKSKDENLDLKDEKTRQ